MKTKAQVLKDYPQYKTLINAVINKVGLDSVEDINRHGIDGGYSGFIYYYDTHRFAMRYRKYIIPLLEEDAEMCGIDVVELVKGFGVFNSRRNGSPMDKDELKNLYKYLGYSKCEQDSVTNVMAWYAAETVCRWFEN